MKLAVVIKQGFGSQIGMVMDLLIDNFMQFSNFQQRKKKQYLIWESGREAFDVGWM